MNLRFFIETFIFALFMAAVGYVLAYGTRAVIRFIQKKPLQWYDGLFLVLSIAGLGCITYAFFEPYQLEITHTNLSTDKFPPGKSVTIVHISDLHCDAVKRLEERIPEVVREQKPDLIVFTGDATNGASGNKKFRDCMSQLSKIAPTFAVNGNHDTIYRDNGRFHKGTGVQLLLNQTTTMTVHDCPLWIAGADPIYDGSSLKILQAVPSNAYSILLNHFPEPVQQAAAANVDLYLCGHTHGGQVRLPIYGALTTASDTGKKYEAGLYRVGNTDMYVNRGIGMTGLPIRFLTPPEITVVTITGRTR